ncbi:sigma-54-dependent Fis family transcriptional regulator [Telmatocola sphagniphila]|uniref:Sigma-54-dependent Fis family transcriptional regulator n=1 Tax=Telmatocola sphagniphila TaxID=1123043 RepID=A0A8E6EWY3_9BACT|nr:sigma-54 dependent transcriptional regulator [Telmatocola sphagniphila]QVL34480.1 sigma-54-dependent Fis family transcriptional regulator [Telmatocola sphagniphila]
MATQPHNSLRILFVDDESSLQEFMRLEMPRLGHQVTVCQDGTTALQALKTATFDAAILDLRMPDMTGIDVLEKLKQVSPDTEAVIMTGYASKETAVEALRLGAFDYITKPCRIVEIEGILIRILERRKLKNKNLALQTRVQAAEGSTGLIGHSPTMDVVHRVIETVAPTDSTVLITGETGSGKDVVARTIYQKSRRADMPFVPVNCGALSPTLVESELFGHRKGAFTGADRDHKGLFEVANGGTLFLDELGELNKNIQVKLLRFLESGEVRRLGDTESIRCNVRVICATNRDLHKMIQADEFREDLMYRLNTFEIQLPPLRERREDLPQLAKHLLARSAKRTPEQVANLLKPETIDAMLDYEWPGNVRELANAMEYAYIVAGGQEIGVGHLPANVRLKRSKIPFAQPLADQNSPMILQMPGAANTRTLHDIEMEHILRVLEKNNRNKPATAAELGISLKTLYNKLNRWEEQRKTAG